MPTHQLAALNKGNTELGESTTFRVSRNKPLCFLGGYVSLSLCANRALKNGLGKEPSDIKYVRIFHVQGGLLLPEYTFSWTALIWFEILNNLRNPSHIFKSALSIGPFSSIFILLQIWSTLKTPSNKLSSPPFLNSQNYCNMCLNFLSPFLCLPLFLQPNTLPPGIDLVLY